MPAEFTHILIAAKVWHRLKKEKLDLKQMLLGSIVPDLFMYPAWDDEIVDLSKKIHHLNDPNTLLKTLGRELRNKSPEFGIGIATHFVADIIFHPYIDWRCKNNPVKHGLLERCIDRALWEVLYGKSPLTIDLTRLLPKQVNLHQELAFGRAAKAQGLKYRTGWLMWSYNFFRVYWKLNATIPGIMQIVLTRIPKTSAQGAIRTASFRDPLNIRRDMWMKDGEVHMEDALRLFGQAVIQSVKIASDYLSGMDLSIPDYLLNA